MTPKLWYMHNFDTDKTDYRESPKAAEKWLPYIPNVPGARNLFLLYIETGTSPDDAAISVLSRCVGE